MKYLFFFFLALVFFLPVSAKADLIINRDYDLKHCQPGEVEVVCNLTGFAPNAAQTFAHDCDKYKNSNYYFLVSEEHSYGGVAKYCQINNNPFVKYGYYIIVFLLTFLLELVVLFICGFRAWRSILAIFIANLVTVPLFQYVISLPNFHFLPLLGGYANLIVLEVGVVIVESIIITLIAKKYNFFLTLLFVLIANAVSATLGTWLLGLIFK